MRNATIVAVAGLAALATLAWMGGSAEAGNGPCVTLGSSYYEVCLLRETLTTEGGPCGPQPGLRRQCIVGTTEEHAILKGSATPIVAFGVWQQERHHDVVEHNCQVGWSCRTSAWHDDSNGTYARVAVVVRTDPYKATVLRVDVVQDHTVRTGDGAFDVEQTWAQVYFQTVYSASAVGYRQWDDGTGCLERVYMIHYPLGFPVVTPIPGPSSCRVEVPQLAESCWATLAGPVCGDFPRWPDLPAL